MIIADTNIVSEFMKDAPDSGVLAWAKGIGPTELTISVVTVEEIERGLGRLPSGRRRDALKHRWDVLIGSFEETIATYDLRAARATAGILIDALDQGRPMSLADAQIAGICIAQSALLATRNVKDFDRVRHLDVVNPFEPLP